MILRSATFLLIYLLLIASTVHSQNINGFKIFVSKSQMTSIEFHSEITSCGFLQKSPPYKFQFLGEKTIYLETDKEVKTAYNLKLMEGGRTHSFIIEYKEDVDPSEQETNYSDLKKLAKIIKDFENKSAGPGPATVKADINPPASQDDNQGGNDSNAVSLIMAADRAKKNKDLQTAKKKYEQALKLDPDNNYAKAQLVEVIQLIEEETNAKYTDAITKANNAFYQNQLDQSLIYYNEALEIKKNDKYAATQIQLIEKKLEDARSEADRQQKESAYASYIAAGDKALKDKAYDAARIAYSEAIKIKPNDIKATGKLNSIDKKIITDSLEEETKRKETYYNSLINAGNKALEEKSFNEAKFAFNEALKLKPGDPLAKAKLSAVDQQLYTGFITRGDKALKEKSFNEAKDAYQEALKIKPNDATVKTKLSSLDTQRAQDSVQQVYISYINSGDKALNDKFYEAAKIAYSEALEIKPNDITAKAKLKSLEEKIATDKLESEREKKEKLYSELLNSGNKALEDNSYNDAKTAFNEALKIKPGDAVVESKLLLVNEHLFNQYINEGDEALKKKSYAGAKAAYSNALILKPGDAVAKTKLNSVDTQKTRDSSDVLFDNYVNSGDNALKNKAYKVAKIAYADAMKIKPGDAVLAGKLSTLNREILRDSIEKSQLKTESLYKGYVSAGKVAFAKNLYVDAKNSYNNALLLKPGDVYASTQVKIIDSILAIAIVKQQKDSLANQNREITAQTNPETPDVGNPGTDSVAASSADLKAAHAIEKNMVLIKPRLFKMGSNVGAGDESPMHVVELDSFYIGKYEITQSQWMAIMGSNPSGFKNCADCPVENITWDDAIKFIARLNTITNKKYRLPTEAEWEVVAASQSKKENTDNIAWYNDNSKRSTHPVGLLKPNYFGIYDMFGNVAEWCSDWYSFSSYKKNLIVNPTGPANGKEKVIRGGNWYDMEGAFRISVREKADPDKPDKKIGFRLARGIN